MQKKLNQSQKAGSIYSSSWISQDYKTYHAFSSACFCFFVVYISMFFIFTLSSQNIAISIHSSGNVKEKMSQLHVKLLVILLHWLSWKGFIWPMKQVCAKRMGHLPCTISHTRVYIISASNEVGTASGWAEISVMSK